jgi:hypothetical protein
MNTGAIGLRRPQSICAETAEAVTDSSAGAGKHQTLTPLACRGEGDARRYQGDDLIGATGQ